MAAATTRSPAELVVEAIRADGGRAVASGHDVSDWEQAAELVQLAVDAFGDAARAGQQRRHPAGPDPGQHGRVRLGRRAAGAPQGPRRADQARDGVLARPGQGRAAGGRLGGAHHLDRRVRRQLRAGQLHRGQERRARPVPRGRPGRGQDRGALQRGVTVGADPDHDDAPGRRARRRGRVGRGRPAEPGQRLAADRLAGRGEVPGQRAGVPHLRQPGHRGDDAVDRGTTCGPRAAGPPRRWTRRSRPGCCELSELGDFLDV